MTFEEPIADWFDRKEAAAEARAALARGEVLTYDQVVALERVTPAKARPGWRGYATPDWPDE